MQRKKNVKQWLIQLAAELSKNNITKVGRSSAAMRVLLNYNKTLPAKPCQHHQWSHGGFHTNKQGSTWPQSPLTKGTLFSISSPRGIQHVTQQQHSTQVFHFPKRKWWKKKKHVEVTSVSQSVRLLCQKWGGINCSGGVNPVFCYSKMI